MWKEGIYAVGVDPERSNPVAPSGDELAVVDSGTVGQGDAYPATLQRCDVAQSLPGQLSDSVVVSYDAASLSADHGRRHSVSGSDYSFSPLVTAAT
jgi:hypothetical protein